MPTPVRPRWGRVCAAGAAFVVTLMTVLAGVGLLPSGTSPAAASDHPATASLSAQHVAPTTPSVVDKPDPRASHVAHLPTSLALPNASGSGKRVVFSSSAQRVWLVGPTGRVTRTYLVSGSLTDNLHPGTYAVESRERWATGIDNGGTMQYFVVFTHGQNAAIGFHSVPTKHGRLEETRSQLGTPQSAGAKSLWAFAPVGTKVVVTA